MTQPDLGHCYQILELQYGAPPDQIDEQWRLLEQFYHPDRFPPGTRAYELALQKMKDLNTARDTLKHWFQAHPGQTPPPPRPQSETAEPHRDRTHHDDARGESRRRPVAFRGRDLCRQSLAYLIDHGFLSEYVESGRFVPPPPRARAIFSPEQLMLSHYAQKEGILYWFAAQWELAFKLVRSFTAGAAVRGQQNRWQLEQCYGSFGDLDVQALFQHVTSAFVWCGFRTTDTNDVHRSAQFELTDTCNVMSLPEPYGKWLQLKEGRPQWKMPVELKVVARCAVQREFTTRQTFLHLELSTLAAPLIMALANELADLLHEPHGRLGAYSLRQHEEMLADVLRQRLALPPWQFTT
jgi:hypothetical protein